jgi:hypothetical protein
MELLAFSLAMLSGVGHALWNFLTKRAADKEAFLWWIIVLRTAFLLPSTYLCAHSASHDYQRRGPLLRRYPR